MKIYVKVKATFDCDGNLLPEQIIWENNRAFPIERVSDIRYMRPAGLDDQELRYTCIIQGKEKYLFLYKTRWYVETHAVS